MIFTEQTIQTFRLSFHEQPKIHDPRKRHSGVNVSLGTYWTSTLIYLTLIYKSKAYMLLVSTSHVANSIWPRRRQGGGKRSHGSKKPTPNTIGSPNLAPFLEEPKFTKEKKSALKAAHRGLLLGRKLPTFGQRGPNQTWKTHFRS